MQDRGFHITIDNPSGKYPLIDDRRDFDVAGRLCGPIKEDMVLFVGLYKDKELVRHVSQNRMNDERLWLDHPDLTSYAEELDPGKRRLLQFGFPELQVKDTDHPEESFHDATIKCFYDGRSYKALIVSASDVRHGRLLGSGVDLRDENGKPYSALEEGDYTIVVKLSDKERELAHAKKRIRIGKRKKAAIVRFNPLEHRRRMKEWCQKEDFAIVEDTLPGYLEPYLGTWYYHMGLLPWYRSNDVTIYEGAEVHMFVYLCDPTSTSYETELAYLQKKGNVGDPKKFIAYAYDIGEALLGKGKPYERRGRIRRFEEDEDLRICRIDLLRGEGEENVFDLSEADIEDIFYDWKDIAVKAGSAIAVNGVVRPWQLREEDVILRGDNTYEICHEVSVIRYEIDNGEERKTQDRKLLLERIDERQIGKSVYEFRNVFRFREEDRGKCFRFRLYALNDEGRESISNKEFTVHVI